MAEDFALTAASYDALKWGVDFARRGEFRVALATKIEELVIGYTPPPDSLDRGPRSIYATTAIEEWLRANGFPHAHQRRWISVADQPEWGEAAELYEIDCGTENSLLIQLLIEDDGIRQSIGQVIVTS